MADDRVNVRIGGHLLRGEGEESVTVAVGGFRVKGRLRGEFGQGDIIATDEGESLLLGGGFNVNTAFSSESHRGQRQILLVARDAILFTAVFNEGALRCKRRFLEERQGAT